MYCDDTMISDIVRSHQKLRLQKELGCWWAGLGWRDYIACCVKKLWLIDDYTDVGAIEPRSTGGLWMLLSQGNGFFPEIPKQGQIHAYQHFNFHLVNSTKCIILRHLVCEHLLQQWWKMAGPLVTEFTGTYSKLNKFPDNYAEWRKPVLRG